VTDLEAAVVAIRTGGLAVIPTDTVYGLACDPYRPEAVERLAEVKGRSLEQPIALLTHSTEALFDALPELPGHLRVVTSELVPGPYTLVLPNPAQRFPWLTGSRSDTLGARVPAVEGTARVLLETLGAVAATSANLHGAPDPRRIEDLQPEITSAAAVVDGGDLPGTPSTVLDLTGPEPTVVREGAVPRADALAAVHRLLAQ
jgi:L-threonylcarbamoyladenylate synthase